jgi:transcriptional regulator with XRE-family HTH domain
MLSLGERIQELRKQKNITQQKLAEMISVSKSMINRYENKGVQPPADILNKLADVLQTSVDFLINGNTDEKAKASLKNVELLQRFKEIEAMPDREQSVLLEIISAYVRDFKTKQSYAI